MDKSKDNSVDAKAKSAKASNKNQNSDEETIEHKDDNVTSAPREEEKSSKAEETKVQENVPSASAPKIDTTLSLRDQFKSLNAEQMQKVVDYTMDKVMKTYKDYRYGYHGYASETENNKSSNYSK